MGEGQQVLPLSPRMANMVGAAHSHAYMRLDPQSRAKSRRYTLAGSYFTATSPPAEFIRRESPQSYILIPFLSC